MKDFGARCNLVVLLFLLTAMLGCSGLNANQPSAQSATGLVATAAILDFGTVAVGTSVVRTNTIVNNTHLPLVLTGAQIDQTDFRITGQNLPLRLAPGARTSLQVVYSPSSGGSSEGTVVLASNMTRSSTTFALKGVGSSRLTLTPRSISFGNVQVGKTQTQSAVLSNSGRTVVTITNATISGKGFALTGLNLPMTLSPGQKVTIGVSVTAVSGGADRGTISLFGTTSMRSSGTGGSGTLTTAAAATVPISLNFSVSAMAVASGGLVSNPSGLSFGTVQVGSPKTMAETLTNSGGSSITISQANVSGTAGLTVSGLNTPATLAAGQSASFSVTYTPQSVGSASGSLAIFSNASNATLTVPFTATTATAGVLSTSDSSLSFASVPVGSSSTLSETLTNTGGSSVSVTQATVTGTVFKATGLSLPLTLSPGQSFTFGAVFTPTTGGSSTGSIAVVSNASDPTLNISLAGTASVSGQLVVSPATLNFGNVTVGQTKSLSGSLSASGSSITVSNASMSTSEFTVSGITLPRTLSAGQSASFTITFAPQASGTASASTSFTSNASNPSAQEPLTGSGVAAPQHSVALTWNPSTSTVAGYNVYRGTTTGGPYSKIAPLNADTSYSDSSVQAGQTYFYVTTAVDASGNESVRSNQTQAAVPTP